MTTLSRPTPAGGGAPDAAPASAAPAALGYEVPQQKERVKYVYIPADK